MKIQKEELQWSTLRIPIINALAASIFLMND
jgi:hypothetical protein